MALLDDKNIKQIAEKIYLNIRFKKLTLAESQQFIETYSVENIISFLKEKTSKLIYNMFGLNVVEEQRINI